VTAVVALMGTLATAVVALMAAHAAESSKRNAETPPSRHPGHIASHNILAALAPHVLAEALAVLRFPQASLLIQYFLISTAIYSRAD